MSYIIRKGESGGEFHIEEYFIGQFYWTTDDDEGEGFHPTHLDALQAAIDHVDALEADRIEREEQEENDRLYGTYEQQVRADWMASR